MSDKDMWSSLPIKTALTDLEAALRGYAKARGHRVENLTVMVMADDRSVAVAHHGCNCAQCCHQMIGALATRVFGAEIESETVSSPEPAQAVH